MLPTLWSALPKTAEPGRVSGQDRQRDLPFRDFFFDDRKVTGAQIAEAVGAHSLTDFAILQQLESLEPEALRPTELADLTKSAHFFVIRGDATYRFVVDGLSMEWPQKIVTGQTIKRLAGKE